MRRLALAAGLAALPIAAAGQSCTVSTGGVAFGAYDRAAAAPGDSTGSVTVGCAPHLVSLPLPYSIALAAGASGSVAARRMHAGAAQLSYQLYTGPLRSVVWGDGSAGSARVDGTLTLSVVLPRSASHVVYGRLPAGQTGVAAGSYGDVVTVTVSY